MLSVALDHLERMPIHDAVADFLELSYDHFRRNHRGKSGCKRCNGYHAFLEACLSNISNLPCEACLEMYRPYEHVAASGAEIDLRLQHAVAADTGIGDLVFDLDNSTPSNCTQPLVADIDRATSSIIPHSTPTLDNSTPSNCTQPPVADLDTATSSIIPHSTPTMPELQLAPYGWALFSN